MRLVNVDHATSTSYSAGPSVMEREGWQKSSGILCAALAMECWTWETEALGWASAGTFAKALPCRYYFNDMHNYKSSHWSWCCSLVPLNDWRMLPLYSLKTE